MKRTLALTGGAALVLSMASAAAAQETPPDPPDPLPVVEVRASGSDGNLPEGTLDGLLSTRWSAQTVDQDNPQWIRYDLGAVTQIGYAGIAWHQGGVRQSFFDLQVSDDGQTWRPVLTGGASSGTALDLEPVEFDAAPAPIGVAGRYLRYLGFGNTNSGWNSLTEVRLYPPNPDGPVVHSFADNIPEPDPDAEPFTAPGLTEPDGSPHPLPPRNQVTGDRLDVTGFGADPADSPHDDTSAINAAIDAAEPGDEVFLPAGTYNLHSGVPSDASSQIALRSGVNLRGAGQDDTIVRSSFTEADGNGKVVRGFGVTDLVISDLTVTSTFDGPFSDDTNADAGGGPQYGIFLSDAVTRPSQRIYIERVTVERFERMGIRVASSRDVVVSECLFRDATSVGGGGRGYGVSIQGIAKVDRLGFPDDSRHNVVRDSTFEGPYLRHGVVLQFVTHNNLVAGNQFSEIALDAVDLHGEDEYRNEVRGNQFDRMRAAAIALGNTGGSAPSNHDASGPGNWIHRNQIVRAAREGIKVHMGTPDTLIERNTIIGLAGPARGRGIQVLNAPGTVVRNNVVSANRGDGFWGIHLGVDPGDGGAGGVGSGVPTEVTITGNTIINNTGGVLLEAGESVTMTGNTIRSNDEDIRLDVAPPPPGDGGGGDPPAGDLLAPTDDSMIDNGSPDATFGDATLLKWKRNASGSIQRIAYYRFEVDDPAGVESATLEVSAKLTASNPDGASYDYQVLEVDDDTWTEDDLTWNTAPAREPADAAGIGTFTMAGPLDQVERIQVDVTEYVRAQADGVVTLIILDPVGQNGNLDSYSKERGTEALRPGLRTDR
ncbi:MAG: DNRLRE domain-containing protein [Micromonosporaceae bacterium]|nr:DNRLRE domain-containing protein [Micromonosporaceae bacterium]